MKMYKLDSRPGISAESPQTDSDWRDGGGRMKRRSKPVVASSPLRLVAVAVLLAWLGPRAAPLPFVAADDSSPEGELKVIDPTQIYYVGLPLVVTGEQKWRVYVPEGRKIAISCGPSINGRQYQDLTTKPLSRIVLDKGESEVEIVWRGYLVNGPDFTWRVRNLASGKETKAKVPLPRLYVEKFLSSKQSRSEQYFAPPISTRVRTTSPMHLFRAAMEPERPASFYADPKDIPFIFVVILHDLDVPLEPPKPMP